jgi:hypothetical protein
MPSAGFKLANQAAADLRLRSRSHRDRLLPTTMMMIMMIIIIIITNISIIYNRAVLSPVSYKNIFYLLFKIIIKFSLIESGLAVRVWRSNCWREFIFDREPGSLVIIVSGYGLDDRAIEFRSPTEAEDFFPYPLCPDRLWGPPSLLYNGYGGPFLLG